MAPVVVGSQSQFSVRPKAARPFTGSTDMKLETENTSVGLHKIDIYLPSTASSAGSQKVGWRALGLVAGGLTGGLEIRSAGAV